MTAGHIPDLSEAFFAVWRSMCRRLRADPLHVAGVAFVESGLKYWAENQSTHASGLIQFMPDTLEGIGWMKNDHRWKISKDEPERRRRARSELAAEFRKLDAIAQVPFVERYFLPYVKHDLDSIAKCYLAVFLPAFLKKTVDPDEVLAAKWGRLGNVYSANAVLDDNKDLKITIGELETAVHKNCWGPRWLEIATFITGRKQSNPEIRDLDLGTIRGQQQALNRVGIELVVDGITGPRTRAAIMHFQGSRPGLIVDGIVGPLTRAALREATQN